MIYIICGVHNSLEYTKELLLSIDNSDYKKIRTVIIDDGSTDKTHDFIEKYYPKIVILKGDGNLWWTGAMEKGVNYVLKHCKNNDYILTINNDCVFDRGYVRSLVNFIKDRPKTIIGSLVLDLKTGNVVDAGVMINWKRAIFEPIPFYIKKNGQKGFVEVDTLSTKGALFPVEVFKKIGNFDKKNFPHYLSDYEFSCRAKQIGYRLIINYDSVVKNDNSRTGNEIKGNQKMSFRQLNNYLFSKKSKINIFDQVKFFWFYCPRQYRCQCIFSLFKKALYLLSLIQPFYLLRKIFF